MHTVLNHSLAVDNLQQLVFTLLSYTAEGGWVGGWGVRSPGSTQITVSLLAYGDKISIELGELELELGTFVLPQ